MACRVSTSGTSYVNISLVHLADHLIYLSSSSSFWFSLNSSYDNEFHLSKHLDVTPQDYEFLLVAADLTHFHKRWGFSIKMMKLKLFLEWHLFTTISCDGTLEVDEKKVDLNAFMKGEPPKHRERVYSCCPLVATPYCPLIVLGTTPARGSRATGGTTTATGGTKIAMGGTTTSRGSRATGGTTMATGGTAMAWDSRATGGMMTVTVGTTIARGSRVTGNDGDGRHDDGKGQQGDRRHDDGDGWNNDGKGQQGNRRHDNGDGQHNNGQYGDGKRQQGDRRHDYGDGRHDDGKGQQGNRQQRL
jgi:hypothetical protein